MPQAMASVRGDSFVVETNIHYPIESSVIGDGLHKVVTLAAALVALHGQPAWRQYRHVLKIVQKIVRDIRRAACAKRKGADRLKPGYSRLLDLAKGLLACWRHPGVESAIGALQGGNGQKRCHDRSERGYARYVGLGILGRNLQVLGKLLLSQDDATCQAAKSKRKQQAE